jgi:hypothetical protein
MFQDPSMWGSPQLTPSQYNALFVLVLMSSAVIGLMYTAFWLYELWRLSREGKDDDLHSSDSESGGDST